MNTQSLNLPEDLGYTARHVWARKAGDTLVTLDVNAGKAKAAAAAQGSLPQAAASTAPSSEGADKAADAKKEGGND